MGAPFNLHWLLSTAIPCFVARFQLVPASPYEVQFVQKCTYLQIFDCSLKDCSAVSIALHDVFEPNDTVEVAKLTQLRHAPVVNHSTSTVAAWGKIADSTDGGSFLFAAMERSDAVDVRFEDRDRFKCVCFGEGATRVKSDPVVRHVPARRLEWSLQHTEPQKTETPPSISVMCNLGPDGAEIIVPDPAELPARREADVHDGVMKCVSVDAQIADCPGPVLSRSLSNRLGSMLVLLVTMPESQSAAMRQADRLTCTVKIRNGKSFHTPVIMAETCRGTASEEGGAAADNAATTTDWKARIGFACFASVVIGAGAAAVVGWCCWRKRSCGCCTAG